VTSHDVTSPQQRSERDATDGVTAIARARAHTLLTSFSLVSLFGRHVTGSDVTRPAAPGDGGVGHSARRLLERPERLHARRRIDRATISATDSTRPATEQQLLLTLYEASI